MKNIFKTKAFPAAILSFACIGILSTCWLVDKEEKTRFRPQETVPDAEVREWVEAAQPDPTASPAGHIGTDTSAYAPAQPREPADSQETYPRVVDDTEPLVVIDFTPEPEQLQPEAPETPVVTGDSTDPSMPPVYTPEDLKPAPAATPAQPAAPAAGSSNGNGAVYDPVFGWVVPGQVSQTSMDSAGDPNKMVGNMGN